MANNKNALVGAMARRKLLGASDSPFPATPQRVARPQRKPARKRHFGPAPRG